MRILLVEGDKDARESFETRLRFDGFNIYSATTGEDAIDLAKNYDYDLIILVLSLPDMTGYHVIKTLRVSRIKTPIIAITSDYNVEKVVKSLGMGADDCMSKPFDWEEMTARIYSVVRRCQGHSVSIVSLGELTMDLQSKEVVIAGERIHLTGKETGILELLILKKGYTVTKEMMLNHLYGGLHEPELKIVDVFICKIRKKLSSVGSNLNYVETIWGRGYSIVDPLVPKNNAMTRHISEVA